jgi:hypothetical protein
MSWNAKLNTFNDNKETYLQKISSFTDKLGSINPDENMSEAKLKVAGMSEIEVKFFKFFLSRTKGSKVNDALKSAGLEEEFASLIPFLEKNAHAEKMLEQIGLRGYQLFGIKELINKVAPNGLGDEPEEDSSDNNGGTSQEAGLKDDKQENANPGEHKPEDNKGDKKAGSKDDKQENANPGDDKTEDNKGDKKAGSNNDQQEKQGNSNQNNCFTKDQAENLFEEFFKIFEKKHSNFFTKDEAENLFREQYSNFFTKDEDKKDFEGFSNRFQEELDNLKEGYKNLEKESQMHGILIENSDYIQTVIFCNFFMRCNLENIYKNGFSGFCNDVCSGDY